MTLDTLLAIIGLGVAAYQIMPRARQLDFRVRLHLFDIGLLSAGALAIAYLQLYPVFAAFGLTPHLGLRRWEITPERMSFLVFLLVLAIVTINVRISKVPRRSLPRLRELVEELLWHDPSEAALVVERHLARIRRIAKTDTVLDRVRKWAVPTHHEELLEITRLQDLSEETTEPNRADVRRRQIQRTVRNTMRVFRDRVTLKGADDAAWLLSRVQRSREFAVAVARRRPYFGLAFMIEADHDTYEFMRHYFEALLQDPASILHRELRDNDTGGGRLPTFGEADRLLRFLFEDPKVAEKLHIYQPVGDAALAKLLELSRDPASDDYNLSADDHFRERGQWNTFLYPVVVFFDLMVTASLHAGIQWHMWLLYYAEFTDRMIENHKPPGLDTERDSFYETRYSYLIYRMVARCRDWILEVEKVQHQPHIVQVHVKFDYENDNIPKTAIICLIRMLSSILVSDLPEKFRHRIADMVFETYFKLRKLRGCEKYAEVLLDGLRQGYFSYDAARDAMYQREIRAAFRSFDTIPHMMEGRRRGATSDPLQDFRAALSL